MNSSSTAAGVESPPLLHDEGGERADSMTVHVDGRAESEDAHVMIMDDGDLDDGPRRSTRPTKGKPPKRLVDVGTSSSSSSVSTRRKGSMTKKKHRVSKVSENISYNTVIEYMLF